MTEFIGWALWYAFIFLFSLLGLAACGGRGGLVRVRQPPARDFYPTVRQFGGTSPWRRCDCGKWISNETGEHVNVVSMSLTEWLEKNRTKCPDTNPRGDERNG